MKILLASNSYPTPDNPLQAFIGVLARELVRQGHEVTVIAPVMVLSCMRHGTRLDKKYYYDEFEHEGRRLRVEVYRPRIYAPGEGRFLKMASRVCQNRISAAALRIGKRFDVAYCHFWSSAIHLNDYVETTGIPLIVACGEDKINIQYLRSEKNIKDLNQLTCGVICVSSKNKEESIAAGLTTPVKCIVLPNAVDAGEFKQMDRKSVRDELGFPQDAFIVAFLGRFYERKGPERVSEAIKRCNDSYIKAVYVGKKAPGDTFQPLGNEALFFGALAHGDVVKYLNSADVFVLPSLAEGCSNAIVEAMACGLPIISSDLPFNYDILNSNNSIMVDPMDVDAISNAIKQLKHDEHLREKLSEGALLMAKELTIEKRAAKIASFIENKIRENGTIKE